MKKIDPKNYAEKLLCKGVSFYKKLDHGHKEEL